MPIAIIKGRPYLCGMKRFSVLLFTLISCATLFGDTPEHENFVQYVQGATQFHFDLYAKLPRGNNLFYSPYSISTALTLAAAGAKGDTAKEMISTLHLNSDLAKTEAGAQALIQLLNGKPGEERGYSLNTANAFWLQKSIPFNAAYLELGKKIFQAELRELDFATNTEKARLTINQWVADQTKNKIQNLIQQGSLTKGSRFVITNAIYFKGVWQEPFEKKLTKKETFFASGEKKITADMMHLTAPFSFVKTDGVSVVELPYKRSSLSMILVVPDSIDGLAAVEQRLTPEILANWTSHFAYKRVMLTMPKFTITSEFRLEDVLSSLGMRLAFTGAADFSAITDKEKISIGAIAHKAFIDVDEKGTEAAAATALMYKATAMIEDKPEKIVADRPFLIFIRENDSGAILFAGRVALPKAAHGK